MLSKIERLIYCWMIEMEKKKLLFHVLDPYGSVKIKSLIMSLSEGFMAIYWMKLAESLS